MVLPAILTAKATLAVIGVTAAAGAVALTAASDAPAKEPDRVPKTIVTRVVDGDTVEIGSGFIVRLIGIDTPESGVCGYQSATEALRDLVEGKPVTLTNPDRVQDVDRYGRLLRYVNRSGADAGFELLKGGFAAARYDSRDGYDPHPREDYYRAADQANTSPCEEKEQALQEQREERRHASEVAAKGRD